MYAPESILTHGELSWCIPINACPRPLLLLPIIHHCNSQPYRTFMQLIEDSAGMTFDIIQRVVYEDRHVGAEVYLSPDGSRNCIPRAHLDVARVVKRLGICKAWPSGLLPWGKPRPYPRPVLREKKKDDGSTITSGVNFRNVPSEV